MATSSLSRPARAAAVPAFPEAISLPARLFALWHLLSLDAPTVAFVWCCAFVRVAGLRPHLLTPALLALATWLLYVTDRLLDSAEPSRAPLLQHRHHFHARHRSRLLKAAAPAALLLVWLALTRMDVVSLHDELLLSAAALLYLSCVHLPARFGWRFHTLSLASRLPAPHGLPKELAVGIIFAAACVVPAVARQPLARTPLALLAAIFALLCWLNCVAIEGWETPPSDEPHGQKAAINPGPTLHPVTRAMSRRFTAACLALIFVSVTAAFISFRRDLSAFAALALAVSLSSLLLLHLHRQRRNIPPLFLRAAADLVLLTPPLFLVPARLIATWATHLH